MHQTLLIDLWGRLSGTEQRKFCEYVYSPYHNKNQKVRLLCDLLYQHRKNLEHQQLAKRAVYPIIFPKEKEYQELKINNIISDLLQLLYAFLAQEVYRQKTMLPKKYLQQALSQKRAERHLEKNLRQYRQQKEKAAYRSYDYFLDAYDYFEQEDHYQLQRAMRSNKGHLQKQNDALDLFYHINKFRMACEMTSRNLVAQAGYQSHYLEDLLRWYETGNESLQKEPALELYYKVLQMLQGENQQRWFAEVRSLLKKRFRQIPKKELWPVYSFALNYCIIQINSGASQYYHDILELYKELLERKIIFVNGYLTQWSFKNIITTGIRLQEFDWTEQFIHDYENTLLPDEKENAIVYNLAALFHARNDFQQALQLLHNVEFTDTSYHLGAKTIQLKSFYELQETEAFLSLIEAFRKYLVRNRQISTYRKKANNNMLKLVRKIYQLRQHRSILAVANFNRRHKSIEQQLKELHPIANKEWLEEIFRGI